VAFKVSITTTFVVSGVAAAVVSINESVSAFLIVSAMTGLIAFFFDACGAVFGLLVSIGPVVETALSVWAVACVVRRQINHIKSRFFKQ
jgi:hypothetical protein